MSKQQTIIIAYVPVLHQGYVELLSSQVVDTIYILGPELIKEVDYLRKEIRAMEPKLVQSALIGLGLSASIELLNRRVLNKLAKLNNLVVIAPDEDVTQNLLTLTLPQAKINWSPVFLRWHRDNALVNQPITADLELSANDPNHQEMLARAFAVANQSSDWWRHVGAVLVDKEGKFIASAANRHLPSDHTPYALGDTRSLFKRGQYVEVGTAIHAEGALIAQAAKHGVSLKGAKLFLTDFPCPYCARMVANSGISELYFVNGYAMLDGENILKKAGIKLLQLHVTAKTEKLAKQSSISKPYQR